MDIFDSTQHKTLVNGENRNGFINMLTVFFVDGTAMIEEIHQSNKNSISSLEYGGKAASVTLPEVLFEDDMAAIAELLKSMIAVKDWDAVKKALNGLSNHVDFYADYIDGSYESCETEEEMEKHIKKHGTDVSAIAAEIRGGGCDYVWLEEWIKNYLS